MMDFSETKSAAVPPHSQQQQEGGSAASLAADPPPSKRRAINCDDVRRLAAMGLTRRTIALKLGVHPRTIYKIVRRGEIKHHRIITDITEIRRLAALGMTIRMIAAQTGFAYDTIQRITVKHGITVCREINIAGYPAGPDVSEFWLSNDALLIERVNAGDSATQAAAIIGKSKNAVISRAARIGLTWQRSRSPTPRSRIDFPPYGHCLMPSGDLPGMTFCGALREDITKPYCDTCYRTAYLPPKSVDMRVVDM